MFLFQNCLRQSAAFQCRHFWMQASNLPKYQKLKNIHSTLLMVQILVLQHCTMSTTVFLFLQELIQYKCKVMQLYCSIFCPSKDQDPFQSPGLMEQVRVGKRRPTLFTEQKRNTNKQIFYSLIFQSKFFSKVAIMSLCMVISITPDIQRKSIKKKSMHH